MRNHFLRNPDIGGVTDWTVSQPLRRYAMAVDASGASPALAFNQAPAGPSSYYKQGQWDATLHCNVACNRWTFSTWSPTGEANEPPFGGITRPMGHSVELCGSVGVILFADDAASILKSSVNAVQPIVGFTPQAVGSIDGSASIKTGSTVGLPLLGASYSGARGPIVSNKSTYFGFADNHDVSP